MKGYILNPDKEYVNKIIEGIHRKHGHCPCQIDENDTNYCPCDAFVSSGKCLCKLFIPYDNVEEA